MISIIIPTYNEAGNITALINEIRLALTGQQYEIIVVDDNSPDKTWQLVTKISLKNKRVKLIRRMDERGLTSAFNQGIDQSRGEIVGWLDADLSHPPVLLKKMIAQLVRYDVVVASRYVAGGSDLRQEKTAVILSRLINRLAQVCLFKDFTDYTSGYILLNKSLLKKYRLIGDYGEYFLELIFYLKKNGKKIKEIGYINVSRRTGESKTATNWLGFLRRGIKYLITLFYLWLRK